MQFKVPQFIEMEDKLVGSLTLKQVLYLLGAGAMLFGLWYLVPLGSFVLIALPVIVFALLMAFYRPNGRPFIYLLLSMTNYLFKPKLYLWKKEKLTPDKKT